MHCGLAPKGKPPPSRLFLASSLSLPGAASDPDRRLQLRAPASIDVRGLKPEAGAVKQSPGGSAWAGTAQVETRVLKLNVEALKG